MSKYSKNLAELNYFLKILKRTTNIIANTMRFFIDEGAISKPVFIGIYTM